MNTESMENHTLADIWSLCQTAMWKTAWRILHDRADSEDAVMDAVERMAKNLPRLSSLPAEELISLSVIYTRHTAIDIYDRHRRDPIPVEAMEDPADPDTDPETLVMLGDTETFAYTLLCEMPDAMRDVMNLSVYYGMTNREIAQALALPEGTVRTRLSRGRAWLRQKLREKGMIEG